MRPLLPLTAALVLLPAVAAQAHVVPGDGMLGLRVGETQKRVRALLGTPDRSRVTRNEILGRVRTDRYGKATISYDSTGPASHVVTLSTTSRRERLAGGAGVGSRVAALRAAVPGLRCTARHCTAGRFEPGRIVTDFTLRNGRVHRITIGRVID